MGSEIAEALIIRAVIEFRGCIECSENHLTDITYFHKKGCLRGAGLDLAIFKQRLNERFHYMDIHPPKPLWIPLEGRCSLCSKLATGTYWVRYHREKTILYQDPICEEHSSLADPAGREVGYIPGKLFETIFDVDRFLEVLDV